MFRASSKELRMLKVTSFRGKDCLGVSHSEDILCCSRSFTTGKSVDHYKILGLATDSTAKDIKQAYYRLSKVYHPDVNKSPSAAQQFQLISEAYEILGNDLTRRQYDIEKGIIRGDRPLRHGQHKYRPKGTPPTGMSSTYNFDEWYKEHYTNTFERGQSEKRRTADYYDMQKEMKQAYNTDPGQYKMDPMTKTTYFLFAFATLAFILKRIIK